MVGGGGESVFFKLRSTKTKARDYEGSSEVPGFAGISKFITHGYKLSKGSVKHVTVKVCKQYRNRTK